MYLSVHHVRDREAAARQIARVLRPSSGGQALIRSSFADRLPDLPWHRFFPRARAVEEKLFPTVDQTEETFSAVGLKRLTLREVRHRSADSVAEYVARLRLRPFSTFEHLSDDEIAEGFAALQHIAANVTEPQPVEADCDLLVLGFEPPDD